MGHWNSGKNLKVFGLKIVYISMNTLGLNCLEELLLEKADVRAIFTLDERFAAKVSDFEQFGAIAEKHGIPLFKVRNINEPENLHKIKELEPDIVFAIGWSQILSNQLLAIPKRGCVGMHPALLPKNRGRAAIPWQILLHERESGLSFFCLRSGVDNGPIIAQKRFRLAEDETATTFYGKIVRLGREIIRENFKALAAGKARAREQDESRATYLAKRTPADGLIDWDKSNADVYDLVRATTKPYPGAFTYYNGRKLVVWSADVVRGNRFIGVPGQVLDIGKRGAVVACGSGNVLLKEVQLENDGIKNASEVFKKVHEKLGRRVVE